MKFLVTICNKHKAAESVSLPDVFLFEVDGHNGDVQPVPVIHPEIGKAIGMTGLTRFRDGWLVAVQTKPQSLVHLSADYQVIKVYKTTAKDIHSIAVRDDVIFGAACGQDLIFQMDSDGGEALFHDFTKSGTDTIHLNSICWHEDQLFATAFGPKQETLWSSAYSGFLYNVTRDERLCTPIFHPHSISIWNGQMYFCESSKMSIRSSGGGTLLVNDGYTRGLTFSDEFLVVGTSKGRSKSESTGIVIHNPSDPGYKSGTCSLLIYRHSNSLDSCNRTGAIDLGAFGEEIFDVVICDR